MKCRIGLLGLPNVGKSSLFNALQQQSVAAVANYPFCTIDPNVARVPIPDAYLNDLAMAAAAVSSAAGSQQEAYIQKPATMDWIDVAGLAPNAHLGQGLGNQFLGTLRECDALCHVVRVFENNSHGSINTEDNDDTVVHHVTERGVDPIADVELIQLELLLADLEHVQRRLERIASASTTKKSNKADEGDSLLLERNVLQKIAHALETTGTPARQLGLTPAEKWAIKGMGLLTLKPVVYAFNVDEVDFTMGRQDAETRIQETLWPFIRQITNNDSENNNNNHEDDFVLVSAKLEAGLMESLLRGKNNNNQHHHLIDEKRYEYLISEWGMEEDNQGGVSSPAELEAMLSYTALPRKVMKLLDLALVYTGPGVPPERSKTIKSHLLHASPPKVLAELTSTTNTVPTTASDLAGRLHGDIERGFIRAEVISAPALLESGGGIWSKAKEAGRIRTEGRQYQLAPNDVVLVKWK